MARITFIGAAGVVTGSKHLIETGSGARVLLDCGLFQGLHDQTERNWMPPPVDPAHLDAVLLSHGHLDHCGYLPALVRQGFRKPIYCTPATADVTELVLRDAAGLQEDEAARAARHPERKLHATPLYTTADVEKTVPLFARVPYGDERADIGGCTFRFSDAGHILGSEIMEISFDKKKLVFSGDIGRYNRPLLRDPSPIAQSDYVICESTYGDRLHPQSDPQDDLGVVINAAMGRNGVLVIPSFAIGRTQEVLYAIGQLQAASKISKISIYVDSPMGIAADAIMERHPEATRFDLRQRFGANAINIGAQNVSNVRTQQDSIKLNDIASNAIIIASSGMAAGGRVLHHLRNRLPRPNDTICLVGFQAPGTLGQRLLSGQKRPYVMGVPVDVKATMAHIDGFSAHADRDELLRWFGGFQCSPKTFMVHAEPGPAASLAAAVHDKFGFDASAARQGEVVEI
ncbi:MAG: MBL fold metallo-hydrolase [Candidatus Eremiobacteraeota bacterium]|nr:MBL fold metallo-hydrolase [Candidatus Eremiobacteraeota bacterium]